MSIKEVVIRVIREDDIDALVEIDKEYTNADRREYYQRKLKVAHELPGAISILLAAEVDGKIAGFIMGEMLTGEFGIPEAVATLDTIGIKKDFAKKGVATELLEEFSKYARKAGANRIYTRVMWDQFDLLRFFNRKGFVPSKMINLEMPL